MIPSYQEEIRIHKNKDRIFWGIVAIMTVFLYFFFQGYYPNYEGFLNRTEDISKQTFLKPFGIIDIHVFPSPDSININNDTYNNNSKTIFDIGEYVVSIKKKWYISLTFLIDITKKNPFYINVVNLFALPESVILPIAFSELFPYNDYYLLSTTETGSFLLVDTDFQVLHRIETNYRYIGGLYFTDGNNILSYSLDTEKFLNIFDSETGLALQCTDIAYYGEKLFCRDTMQFVGPKTSDIREKILAINDRIILTPKYIYNGDNSNTSWKYFEYGTGTLESPEAVVHINKIPYIFEKGILTPVDKTDITTTSPQSDWGMENLSQVKEIDGETILLGEKQWQGKFRILDAEKQYSGIFDFKDTTNVMVRKLNGAYIFTTSEAVYIYYKGAKDIVKILDNVKIVRMVNSTIFFNKEGKSYKVDLLRRVLP